MRLIGALENIFKLGKVAIGVSSVGSAFAAGNFVIQFSANVPALEVYIESIIKGKRQRSNEEDPRTLIKLRNNGGVMTIKSIQLQSNGQVVKSFSEILNTKTAPYEVCTESSDVLTDGCQGHSFNRQSSIEVCIIRPKKDEDAGKQDWELEVRKAIRDKNLTVKVNYSYFSFPWWGGSLFTSSKVCTMV